MLAVFAALYFCGYALFERIGDSSQAAETELVEQAVRTAALTCYAVEGAYPLGLEYLEKTMVWFTTIRCISCPMTHLPRT